MPALPTITVTQPQADRILVAFGVDQASAVEAYKRWLTIEVRAFVLERMQEKLSSDKAALEAAAFAEAAANLPPVL